MKPARTKAFAASVFLLSFALACGLLASCGRGAQGRDLMIDRPFSFEIKKNMTDDYSTVGTILSSRDEYPLWRENIADCAFCMIKTVEFRDLTAHVMSFDVAASGTAEYIVHGPSVRLRNGLSVGSAKRQVLRAMGKPLTTEGDSLVWKSRSGNYLVFSFSGETVSKIRWHESREATYKNVRVWETRH